MKEREKVDLKGNEMVEKLVAQKAALKAVMKVVWMVADWDAIGAVLTVVKKAEMRDLRMELW